MMKYSGVTFLAPLDWVEGGCPPFRATVDRMLWHIHTHILLSRMLSLRLKVNLEKLEPRIGHRLDLPRFTRIPVQGKIGFLCSVSGSHVLHVLLPSFFFLHYWHFNGYRFEKSLECEAWFLKCHRSVLSFFCCCCCCFCVSVSAKITTSRLWRGSTDLQRNTELLMFFCICFIVCLHKSCDYISIGEITNMNHKCVSLSKLSFGYQFFLSPYKDPSCPLRVDQFEASTSLH